MQSTEKTSHPNRSIVKTIIAIQLFSALLLSLSCGTVDMNFHTRVKPSGDIIQEITIASTGMMTSLVDAQLISGMENEGWQVERTTSGETTTVVSTKEFSRSSDLVVPGFLDDRQSDNFKFYIKNYFVFKEYYFELTIPEDNSVNREVSEDNQVGGSDLISDEMLESMFKFSWTVTLPGKIIDTNADLVSGNSATWNFPYSSMGSSRVITLNTRYINWLVIGIIGGSMALIVLLVFILKRPKEEYVYSGTGQQPMYQQTMNRFSTNCSVCGYPNPPGKKFCVNCGRNLSERDAQQPASSASQSQCRTCGYVNPANSKFCGSCGQSLLSTGKPGCVNSGQLYICPGCGSSVYFGTNPCPYCGSRMRWR
jgi:hypothetical protein